LFSKTHGGLFLDVGAHAGRWVIPLARFFDKVVALEPNPYSSQMLMENVEKAGLRNVAIWSVGASDLGGIRTLSELDGVPSRSTIHPEFSPLPTTRKFQAYFVKLDDWFEVASLLKVDTEGSELEILKGAKKILSNGTRLCVETHSQVLYEKCAKFLRKMGLDFETVVLPEEAPASIHAQTNEKHKYIVRTHG
jgi:FkbM family methyltransferase